MIFKYKGIDQKSGKNVKGIVVADDIDEAKASLRRDGILFTSLTPKKESFLDKLSLKKGASITSRELAILSRDLHIYLDSGLHISTALRLAQRQYANNPKIYEFLTYLSAQTEKGKSLHQAIEEQDVLDLPQFYVNSIKIADQSGRLKEVLKELSEFLKEQDRISKQVQGAFAYPMFIIIVSIFMVAFMISYVVPKITGIFVQMKQELPPITQFVVDLGNFFKAYWLWIAIGIIVIGLLFTLLRKVSPSFRYKTDYILLKLPFIGKITQVTDLARFSYMVSVLLKSGVPFVESIELSSKMLRNSVLQTIFEGATSEMKSGKNFSEALNNQKNSQIVERSFVETLALGEQSSSVAKVLHILSELYLEENKDKISIFLSLLEPALMLIVGGIIGFIVTAMLLPIFSINIQG